MIRSHGRRMLAFGVLPLVLVVVAALPGPLAGDRLPDPLASHWSLDGDVDGTLARGVLWPGAPVVLLAAWILLAARSRGRAMRLPEAVPVLAASGFVAGLVLALTLANLDAPTARDAGSLAPVLVVLPLVAGALAGLAGAWAERGRSWSAGAVPAPNPGLREGEERGTVWAGHASGRVLHAVGVGIAAVVAAIALATGIWGLLAVAVAAGLTSSLIASVDVVAGPRGLTVRVGALGIRAKVIAAEDIASVEAGEIDPVRWGGYGWRSGGPGASAVVVRRGPGLIVHSRDGRRFAVTVDDPGTGAAVLNSVVRGRRAAA